MVDLSDLQKKFIENEIWTLTFSASFQRANVYLLEVKDKEKSKFKTETRIFIENISKLYISSAKVSDDTHIKNIEEISHFTVKYSNILQKGKLNFGVSQKLLNLYLKYQWCLYNNFVPPHFPVDRRIQENIGFTPIVSWTKFEDSVDYMRIIDFVRNENKKHSSIAAFELEHFERIIKTK
jgi:hypothetical protein